MDEFRLAERVGRIPPSETLAITARAAALRAEGRDVVSLAAGEPDFDTPAHIREAAVRALAAGKTRYTAASGTPTLCAAVAELAGREAGRSYRAEDVIVCAGAKQALHNICQAAMGPGDEAVIVAPYWVSYPAMVAAAGGEAVILETRAEDGFRIDPDRLEAALGPRTRVLFLNYPSNPTGVVYDRGTLEAIARVVAGRPDLLVLSDEIYDRILFDGRRHIPFASLGEEVAARTVTVNGVSKTYAMTGWRIGWAVGPREVVAAATALQSHATSGPNAMAQEAALEAITGPQDCVARMVEAFEARRGVLLERLRALPAIQAGEVDGAFYAFPRVAGLYGRRHEGRRIQGSADFVGALLDAEAVAGVPGGAFGADDHVRLSFATSVERIEEGIRRLARFISALAP